MSARDHDGWDAWLGSWVIHCNAEGFKPTTVKIYTQGLANLAEWARANGIGDPTELAKRDVERYLAHFRTRKHKTTGEPVSGAYVRRDYTSLRQFFKWLAAEERIADAMAETKTPKFDLKQREIIPDDELTRLLATCAGTSFAERRDCALIRVLLDCGARRSEIMSLGVEDVDMTLRVLNVIGKGGKPRPIPFGHKTAEALSRYLRTRARHKDSRHPALWLSAAPHRGPMGVDGLRQVLIRRGREAGLSNVTPHRFRHTAYDAFKERGGDDTTAMSLFGWSTRSMLDHYARSNGQSRAVKIAHRISAGDRV